MTNFGRTRNSRSAVIVVVSVLVASVFSGVSTDSAVDSRVTPVDDSIFRVGPSASPTPQVDTPVVPAAYTPVSPLVRDTLNTRSVVDVVVTLDPATLDSPALAHVRTKLRSTGRHSFAGELSRADIELLATFDGARIDANVPIKISPPRPSADRSASGNETRSVGADGPVTENTRGVWGTDIAVSETDTRMVETQSSLGIDGSGVVVAVIDSGVDTNAAGLSGKVVHREDFSTSAASCTDGAFLDPYGHGTHVTSILAGTPHTNSNLKFGRDIRGVAKGASIIDLRIFNCAGESTVAQVETALNWVMSNKDTYGIKVVNMSLGTTGIVQDGLDSTSILVNQLVASGVVMVAAAGNQGDAPQTITSPATAQFATTVGAASVSQYGAFTAPYSSLGPTSDGRAGIDLIAPGSSIDASKTSKTGFGTTVKSGTSMAAPYVAGLAALLIQQNPGEAPGGTMCTVGAGCPAGVVTNTMTNPIQDRMKTSDWYTPGVDSLSGAGLVSVSASLLGESPTASSALSGTLTKNVSNVVRIPPHASDLSVSVYLPESYKAGAFDADTFRMMVVDRNYTSAANEAPCTLLSVFTCSYGAFSFTPRIFPRLLRASASDTFLVLETTKDVPYLLNIASMSDSLSMFTGVAVSSTDLTSSTTATMTLARTVSSSSATTFTVTTTGPLTTPGSITLPAGPSGTSVDVSVTRTGEPQSSEEKIVFDDGAGYILGGRVVIRDTGVGRLQWPNTAGFDDGGSSGPTRVADDGTIFLSARATGLKSSNGYDGIGMAAAGSLRISKIPLTQTSPSQIDLLAIADDGSAVLGRQFPAGAGLVPGDSDTKWTFFVHGNSSGTTVEVGPDKNLWTNWADADVALLMSSDGDSVVWATTYPSGTNPVKLAWQGGTSFATTNIIASFPSTTSLSLFAYQGSHIIVRVRDTSASLDEFRDYAPDGSYVVLDFGGLTPTDNSVVTSRSGSAVVMLNGNSQTIRCTTGGQMSNIDTTFLKTVGSSLTPLLAVAEDCSWVITVWETAPGVRSRGDRGYALIKLLPNGTYTKLDSSAAGRGISWLSNTAGTVFVRTTAVPLEDGDINGEPDIYRGLGAGDSRIHGVAAVITHTASASTITYGRSVSLTFSADSTAAVTAATTSNCRYSSNSVTALSGTGTCTVTISAASDGVKAASTSTVNFVLEKEIRGASSLVVSAPSSAAHNSTANFSVANTTGSTATPTVTGPCTLESSTRVRITSGTGTCRITATVASDTNYEALAAFADVTATRAVRSASELSISSPSAAAFGDTVTYTVTNTTGSTATPTVTGPCTLESSTRVRITSGTGTCRITVTVPSTDDFDPIEGSVDIVARKAVRSASDLSISVNTPSVRAGDGASTTVVNLTGSAVALSADGPCIIDDSGKVTANSSGTCRITATVVASDTHDELTAMTVLEVLEALVTNERPQTDTGRQNPKNEGPAVDVDAPITNVDPPKVEQVVPKGKIRLTITRSSRRASFVVSVNSPLVGTKVTIQEFRNRKWVNLVSKRVSSAGWRVTLTRPRAKFRAVSGKVASPTVTR